MAKLRQFVHTLSSGEKIHVGSPDESSADELLQFSRKIWTTSRYLITQADEVSAMSVESQVQRIQRYLEDERSLLLVARSQNKIVGTLDFSSRKDRRRLSHRGSFGMSVDPDWQGKGIGSLLMKTLIEWVKDCPHLELITLGVLEGNQPAISLYEKFGFKETGREPFGVRLEDGSYLADISMSLKVK